MPKAVLKVEAAPDKTRWTLAQNASLTSPTAESPRVAAMSPTANGSYYGDGYDSYDAFSPTSPRANSMGWKPNPHAPRLDSSAFDDVNYNTPLEERASYQISMNSKMRSRNQDSMGKHLLYETALLDTQAFEVLMLDEVDALKKEHERLNARVEAAQRKLKLESKVRDAAQNLQRLYSSGSKSRADTPQSPDSPKRPRRSLLGQRKGSTSSTSSDGKTLSQAEDELATSTRKVDELNETIKNLLDRRQYVERKLLRHTAAVLAEQREQQTNGAGDGRTNGHRSMDDEDDNSIYSPDEFDGIRDILCGGNGTSFNQLQKGVTSRKLQEEHEHQLHNMQTRLELLNDQLRSVINDAGRTRGVSTSPEPNFARAGDNDAAEKLTSDFDRLENSIRTLQQEQADTRTHFAQLENSAQRTKDSVEAQLEGLNTQLHNTLMLSSAAQSIEDLQDPPRVTGHGYQPQLAYLEESLLSIEQILRQHKDDLEAARESGGDAARDAEREIQEAQAKAGSHLQKLNEYEATVSGLWEIMQSEQQTGQRSPTPDGSGLPPASPLVPSFESFSLQAFNSGVQHLFSRASGAREQQDILRRQIQQQRELNGKSDAEKDRQIEELNTRHEQLNASHSQLQDELARAIAIHEQSEGEANQLRAELLNFDNELDQLRRTAEARHQEREELAKQLETHHGDTHGLRQQIEDLEAQISELNDDARMLTVESEAKLQEAASKHTDLHAQLATATTARDAADEKHTNVQKEMEGLEAEVVRLTTELTMAKAELDGAYGSRAERAKEAQAAEIQALNAQNAQIVAELETLRSAHTTLESEAATLRSAPPQDSSRTAALEQELQGMAADFQELTRESLQLEHERAQLDALIDGLRDRCEALEGQLSDERVRWLGVKSPGGAAGRESMIGREMTSTLVLRQEFKKMMRETRAEGVKLLRVSHISD